VAGKLKRVVLQVVAGGLYYSGLLRLRLFFRRVVLRRKEVCVLGLHRVLSAEEEAHANSLSGIVLRERTFEGMLEFLSREFRVLSLQTFLRGSDDDPSPRKPCCVITFDDGWRDNYLTAYPLLKKHDMPAVIFLVTGLVGAQQTFWVEQLVRTYREPTGRQRIRERFEQVAGKGQEEPDPGEIVEHLKNLPARERDRILADLVPGYGDGAHRTDGDRMLAWEDAAAMQEQGIEFESHTVTHPLLVYEDDATVQNELRASKQTIEQRLRKAARAFAYPNGTYDERVRSMVQACGFECAFTTRRGWYCRGDDRYAIPRIMLHEALVTGIDGKFSPALLSLRLTGWR